MLETFVADTYGYAGRRKPSVLSGRVICWQCCLQDVRDNKTEAANAAPQALRLCQMVGSTAPHANIPMHYGYATSISRHAPAIAPVVTIMIDYLYIHIVFESDDLSHTYFAQITVIPIWTGKVVSTNHSVAEQHVIAPAKLAEGRLVLCVYSSQAQFHCVPQDCLLGHRFTASSRCISKFLLDCGRLPSSRRVQSRHHPH